MNTFSSFLRSLFAPVFLLIFIAITPGRTENNVSGLEERFKASVNTMVQNVKQTGNPAAKRQILSDFLLRMDQRLEMAKNSLSERDNQALENVRAKVQSQYAELNGLNGYEKIPDANLNPFADYIRQDMEQADSYWGSGGIYLSFGAVIIILLLILLLR